MTSWSYSSYSAAVQCLYKYKLVYIDKLDSGTPQSGDLAFGTAMHSAVNDILTGGNGEDLFDVFWKTYEDKELNFGRFKWPELRELGLKFCSIFKRKHAQNYKVIKAEERFYGEYKGVKFEGTPDFYGEYNGRLSLRDFKTSGYKYDSAKSDCSLQLNLYAWLCSAQGLKLPETLGYTVFNKGTGYLQDLTWEFSEPKMYEMLDSLVTYLNILGPKASLGNYPKNPNACLMGSIRCDYFNHCWGKNE